MLYHEKFKEWLDFKIADNECINHKNLYYGNYLSERNIINYWNFKITNLINFLEQKNLKYIIGIQGHNQNVKSPSPFIELLENKFDEFANINFNKYNDIIDWGDETHSKDPKIITDLYVKEITNKYENDILKVLEKNK